MKKNKNIVKNDSELKEQRTVEIKKDGIWKSSFKLVGAVVFVYVMIVSFAVLMPYVVTMIGGALNISSSTLSVPDAVVWIIVGLSSSLYFVAIMLYITKYMWGVVVSAFKNLVSFIFKKHK